MTMQNYLVTVAVRFEIQAQDASKAYEIAQEKAVELAPVVGDFGAFETEASFATPLTYKS
jgi:hypothetical protein